MKAEMTSCSVEVEDGEFKASLMEEGHGGVPVTIAFVGGRMFRKSASSIQWLEEVPADAELNEKLNAAEEAFNLAVSGGTGRAQ